MTAIVNFFVGSSQSNNIQTRQDLDDYNKTMEAMKVTPWVDLVLSIIFSIGAIIALEAGLAPVGLGLLIFAVIFALGAAFLKNEDKTEELVQSVNTLWHLRYANGL